MEGGLLAAWKQWHAHGASEAQAGKLGRHPASPPALPPSPPALQAASLYHFGLQQSAANESLQTSQQQFTENQTFIIVPLAAAPAAAAAVTAWRACPCTVCGGREGLLFK